MDGVQVGSAGSMVVAEAALVLRQRSNQRRCGRVQKVRLVPYLPHLRHCMHPETRS